LRYASLVKKLAKSETEISFTNESDPIGTALRSEKVLLTPHWFGLDFNIEPRTKKLNNFCVNPDFSTPRQAIRSVLEFGLAIQTGDFRIPNMVEDFLKPMTKAAGSVDFVKNITAKRNYFKVLQEHGGKTEACLISQYKLEPATHELARQMIPLLLRINPVGSLATSLAIGGDLDTTQDEDGTESKPLVAGYFEKEPPSQPLLERTAFESLNAKIETSADRSLQKEVVAAAALPTSKQIKKTKGNKFSNLTVNGRRAVKSVRDEKSIEYLAEPVTTWLQGFTTDVIQDVAADLVVAQFGTLLNSFESDDEDDSDGASTDDEDED